MLIANQNIITPYNVTISTVNYEILTSDANEF